MEGTESEKDGVLKELISEKQQNLVYKNQFIDGVMGHDMKLIKWIVQAKLIPLEVMGKVINKKLSCSVRYLEDNSNKTGRS